MPRLRGERGTVWLSYCTNVRPVAGLDDLVRALDALWVPVRERLGLPCPLGLGLWLPAGIARELAAAPERARALREELHGRGLQAVTLNAFPYGEFFAERVKEQVYRPAWYERERLEYTVAAAQVLAELLPAELERGTISTLPLAWRPDFEERGGEAMLAGPMLIEAATALAEIEDRTGKRIQLGLEPEPGCVLETAEQARGFMLELCKGHSLSALFDRHLGVCVDCCHEAVMGEQPAAGLRALFEWGVGVAKVHLSAALEGPLEALARYAEPRWLHQTVAVDRSARAADLPEALRAAELAGKRVRTHFHVPVHVRELGGGLGTTAPLLAEVLDVVLGWREVPHLEIETYTWQVLPDPPAALADGIAAEIEHVLGLLAERGLRPG